MPAATSMMAQTASNRRTPVMFQTPCRETKTGSLSRGAQFFDYPNCKPIWRADASKNLPLEHVDRVTRSAPTVELDFSFMQPVMAMAAFWRCGVIPHDDRGNSPSIPCLPVLNDAPAKSESGDMKSRVFERFQALAAGCRRGRHDTGRTGSLLKTREMSGLAREITGRGAFCRLTIAVSLGMARYPTGRSCDDRVKVRVAGRPTEVLLDLCGRSDQ